MLVRRQSLAIRRPPAHGVDVWRLNISQQYDRLDAFSAHLSHDEHDRARQFLFERDRQNFVVVRGVLRAILGQYLDVSPDAVRFTYGDQQKPALVQPEASAIQFNVSHSSQRALIAVASGREIGADLERLRRLPDLEQLMRYCCTPREQNILAALTPLARQRAFFSFWTAKEAYVKAHGAGLSISLQSIELSIYAARARGFLALGADDTGLAADPTHWTLMPVSAGHNFVGGIVTHGPVMALTYHDWR